MQEDPEIRSQKYVALSFLNSITDYQLKFEEQLVPFLQHSGSELSSEEILTDYRNYHAEHLEKLSDIVSIYPSIKVRGLFRTFEDANLQAQRLKKKFKKTEPINIYIVSVGKWVPFMTKGMDLDVEKRMQCSMYRHLEMIEKESLEFDERMARVRKEAGGSRRKPFLGIEEMEAGEILVDPLLEEEEESQRKPLEPFDPSHDYLVEDKSDNLFYFACISFNDDPFRKTVEMTRECTRRFIASFSRQYFDSGNCSIDELYEKFLEFARGIDSGLQEQTIACVKIRGAYMDTDSAERHCKMLQLNDTDIDTLVADMGMWLEFDPNNNSNEIKTKYANSQLEAIHTGFTQNTDRAEIGKAKMRNLQFDPDNYTQDLQKDCPREARIHEL